MYYDCGIRKRTGCQEKIFLVTFLVTSERVKEFSYSSHSSLTYFPQMVSDFFMKVYGYCSKGI